mmetsp:Transcript_31755/g.47859  ORF Transcript_31755/g.47859 Transcript_31755/m.47859 type:complete len:634 (+) Transcript_31755:72-1973(+)
MELDPILAMEDSLPMMMPAAAPASNDNATKNNNPRDGTTAASSSSSSSIPRDEDPVTSLLGGGGGGSTTTTTIKPTFQERPSSALPSTPNRTPTESNNTQPSASTSNNPNEELTNALSNLLLTNQLPQSSISTLQSILRENATLKEKNSKLKSLLGRSAKAQRDAKNELEQLKKLYEELGREKERLEHRVEVLANRPTHMDLLADFETNFDRALLAIGESKERNNSSQQQQSGGEDAAERSRRSEEEEDDVITAAAAEAAANSLYEELNSPSGTSFYNNRRQSSSNTTAVNNRNNSNNNDSLLLSELTEAKSRITHLETLNTSLHTSYTHLEQTHKSLITNHSHLKNTLTNTQLELRMSKMETDHAQRTLREKEAMVNEMQLEINLVTQSAVEANKRAAEGYEVAQSVRMDKEYVDGLEAKVVALQDWALASTESKQLTMERCRGLEGRVGELEGMVELLKRTSGGSGGGEGMISLEDGMNINDLIPLKKVGGATGSSASSLASTQGGERILWTKSSSLVVGAGMVGHSFIELGSVQIESYETVTLRWKFDLTREEEDIYFSILKGICEDKRKQRSADACFRSRHVKGGGGGDVSGAFAVQNACTLVWSNEMSWFRPKTIKWTVEAVAIEWSD